MEHNDVQRARKTGLRWAKSVHLVRCGACPIHRIALRIAPARVNGFVSIKRVNNYFLWYYVWGGKQRAGSIIRNPYFPKKGMVIVLRDSRAKTGMWEMETRDIAADFRAAFGIAPKLADLRHVSISADTEDTRTFARSSIRKFRIIE